jgi:hypothetical protein
MGCRLDFLRMKIKSNGNGFPGEAGPTVEVAATLADSTRCF